MPQPTGSMDLLETARTELDRLTPRQAFAEQENGTVIIDVRT